ncbi:MAG: hypothetical protein QW175_05875 [Candidatus Bathyarchaeia archaeon]
MKIQIVGYGTVGSAQAYLMQKLGHETFIYDPYKGYSKIQKDADITFICTPENNVEEAIQTLISEKVQGLYAIKSTVPVGTTQNLIEKYDVHICHNPEFLREKYAYEDVITPSRIVIGQCCAQHGNCLDQLYRILNKPIYRVNPTTSELIKLVSNALRAVSISFWNELYLLCQKVQADIKVIAEAADPAKVLGEWEGGKWGTRFFGKPYGGKCLPKDMKHLIDAFIHVDLNPAILEAVEKVNRSIKNAH